MIIIINHQKVKNSECNKTLLAHGQFTSIRVLSSYHNNYFCEQSEEADVGINKPTALVRTLHLFLIHERLLVS